MIISLKILTFLPFFANICEFSLKFYSTTLYISGGFVFHYGPSLALRVTIHRTQRCSGRQHSTQRDIYCGNINPVTPTAPSFPAHLSSRAKRGNLRINNLRGEIRRAGFKRLCFYFSFLYILCITLPPVKTIILTASIEKSSASTINGLSSLPSARTL